MRILALDVGEKYIGVAISDPTAKIAQALTTFKRSNFSSDLRKLKEIVSEYGVCEVVVGIPLTLKGEIGKQAEEVKKYVEKLKKSLDIRVVGWDERFTTLSAKRVLGEAEVRGKKKKPYLDKLAASFILQSYLDSKHSGEKK